MMSKAVVPFALLSVLLGACAGSSDVSTGSADITSHPHVTSDAAIEKALEAATKGLTYTSESDYPWTYVTAKGAAGQTGELPVEDVRKLFATYVDEDPDTDKPLAKLVSETRTFAEWTAEDAKPCDDDSAEECAQTQKLDLTLKTNLTDLKVYLFGENGSDGIVQGTAVSIFILGRTPEGNWAGVRTIAIWT